MGDSPKKNISVTKMLTDDSIQIIPIYTYKLTNCTNKLRNASTRLNNYIFITTLDKG